MATSKKSSTAKKGSNSKTAAKKGASRTAAPARGKTASSKTAGSKTAAKGGASRGANGGSKTASKKSAGGAKKSTRQPSAAFMKAMQPDAELSAVVGNKPMPRTEVTKKLWAYIKKNDLQDPKERRMINADDKLRPVFGGKKQVSMFDMTKLVNQHLKEA